MKERRNETFQPQDLLTFLEQLFTKERGLKVFVHPKKRLQILIVRDIAEQGNPQIFLTLFKSFGRWKSSWWPNHREPEVKLEEVFVFYPKRNSVSNRMVVWVESPLGGTELCQQRDEREITDLNNLRDCNRFRLRNLLKILKESTRVDPYTAEPLPYFEETEIDEKMSATLATIDNAGKQIHGALREGFKLVRVETEFDEKGHPHISVDPKF